MKNKTEIVRSSFISTKFVNKNKVNKLKELHKLGKELTENYLKLIWRLETQKFASTNIYKLIENSNFTARFKQICCKKAIDIKRSITDKINKKLFILDKIDEEITLLDNLDEVHMKLKNKEKIEKFIRKIDKVPNIDNFNLELNSNIVKINLNEPKKYNKNWINLSSLSNFNLKIPFLATKHFNKFYKNNNYKLSNFIQIYTDGSIKVVFKSKVIEKTKGVEISCDIGLNKVYSLSNNNQSSNDKNKYELTKIISKICKTKNGSKNNKKRRTYRDNYIRETINKIDFGNIKVLYIEDIKYLRYKKKKLSRFMRSWTYTTIFNKLKSICDVNGTKIISVRPTNTSRRCFNCGWTCINNRNKEEFNCVKCNYNCNSDINAAKNILFIKKEKEILGNSTEGFYFN